MNRRESLKSVALLVLGIAAAPLGGCRRAPKGKGISSLSTEAQALIALVAETILPETSTAGAQTAGVAGFVVRALNSCLPAKQRDQVVRGLDALEQSCYSSFGHSFSHCTSAQQREIVEKLDREAFGLLGKIKAKLLRRDHYFKTLKRLCVSGYFTSRQGATEALAYDPVPGRWSGCVEMKPGQKVWAL